MTVAELLARMSSREISEWICFFDLEGPPGEARADWRAGLIASTIANVNRDQKKRREPFGPGDFMPRWGDTPSEDERPVQTAEQQIAMARRLARALGGTITVGEG